MSKIGGAVRGFVSGAWLAFVLVFIGAVVSAVPLVGLVMAVACIGIALTLPLLGAWVGYRWKQ